MQEELKKMKFALYSRKSTVDDSKQIQSIENQIQVLTEKARKDNLKIVKIYKEEKSAKIPGRRPQFEQMIKDIEDGVIDGIICWKLDRLSRNPICGGKIQYFLQTNKIKQIVTYERIYYPNDNSMMMTLELGLATEYSIALGKNVKRGMNFKVEKGQYPNTAPIGYLNTPHLSNGERVIVLDKERAPLVRKLWDLVLDEELSISEIIKKAEQIGLKTRPTRKAAGKKLSRHGLHCIFSNPFYYGFFRWHGELHQGKHEPLITKEEFDRVQEIISGKKCAARPAKHKYAFKTLIYCGECGASVTAEQKNKIRKDKSINQRTYYRCTHRKVEHDCKQPAIREEAVEKQFQELLDSVSLPDSFVGWVKKWLFQEKEVAEVKRDSVLKQQQFRVEKINRELDKLLELRINDEIEPEIFKIKKNSLIEEKHQIESSMYLDTDSESYRIDKTVELFEFCKVANILFHKGNYDDKKMLLQALGSRFYLQDQKLKVRLAEPLKFIQEAVSEEWVLDPMFATLKTKVTQGETASERTLIKNGADDGT